jgi:hypothetical protein
MGRGERIAGYADEMARNPEKPQSARSDLIAAAVFVVIAVVCTGFPMLAIASGHPLRSSSRNPNDIGGYFLASVACIVTALWFTGRAILTSWRSRRK